MATNFLWGPVGSVIHLLTTELNTLATAGGSVYGPEVGGATKEQRGMLYLHLASNSLAFTSASYVSVYLVNSSTLGSGATYPTYTSGAAAVYSGNGLVANIAINPKTQAANVVDEIFPHIIIPAGFYKAILINQSGVTLPASGNTLDLYPTPTQY